MDPFAVSHLSDDALLLDGKRLVGHGFKTDAMLLTRITEIDCRQLYRREGHPSMYSFMIGEWHLSEDAAYKRIHGARVAQRFPAVLIALAEGRLHMRAVLMLACRLTPANAEELVAAATHKSRFEIQRLLSERFPQPDLPERFEPIGSPPAVATVPMPAREAVHQLAPEQVHVAIPEQRSQGHIAPPVPEPARQPAPIPAELPARAQRVTPLSPERFGLQLTLDREAHDLLQCARELMGHENPSGEILPVLKGALRLFVDHLRERKFAATNSPRHSRPSTSPRHIPAAVRRAVWERDGGRCTFVGASGKRCPARGMLEFDHRVPVAQGGQGTVENVRLVCRAHNQYAAERAFGADFIHAKRRAARERAATGGDVSGRPRVRTGSRP